MLELYKIEGTTCTDPCEVDGKPYNTPDTWPTFAEDLCQFQKLLRNAVDENKALSILRIFDGEFLFLQGIPGGNISHRHFSGNITPEIRKKFRTSFLSADYVLTQLYEDQVKVYTRLFPERPFDLPMEFIYGLTANRWLFKTFAGQIGLIGGDKKMAVIKELMKRKEYRDYLGLDEFTDYLSVPERFTANNPEQITAELLTQLPSTKSRIFLCGMGIGKLCIIPELSRNHKAVFLDFGCGLSALAGTVGTGRPYYGRWTNFRLKGYNYDGMDPTDYTRNQNVVELD